jgi:hypothetical protein
MRLLRAKYNGEWVDVEKLPPDAKCEEWETETTPEEIEQLSHISIIKSIKLKKEA